MRGIHVLVITLSFFVIKDLFFVTIYGSGFTLLFFFLKFLCTLVLSLHAWLCECQIL